MPTPLITGMLGLGVLNNGVLTEPTAAEYVRQFITFSTFPNATGTNDEAQNFGVPVTAWGTLTSWGIFDGAGNMVFADLLPTPISAVTEETVTVFAGTISLTFASANS